MELFKPAWKSKDRQRAEKAIRRIHNQKKLYRIIQAKSSREKGALSAAMENLTDPLILRTIASEGPFTVSRAALDKLTREEDLLYVALHSRHTEAEEAVKKIDLPRFAARLAAEAESEEVRAAAVRRISDRGTLPRLYAGELRPAVRRAILELTEDPELLKSAALGDSDGQNRLLALEKIRDQAVLEEIVFRDEKHSVCSTALRRIQDSSVLERAAREHPDRALRAEAAARLADKELRLSVLLSDSAAENRLLGLSLLPGGDERLLRLALEDSDEKVRTAAVERIDDHSFLLSCLSALHGGMYHLRDQILERLTKEELLSVICEEAEYEGCCVNAFSVLRGLHRPTEEDYKRIAASVSNEDVLSAAQKAVAEAEFRRALSASERGRAMLKAIDGHKPDAIVALEPVEGDSIRALLLMMELYGSEQLWGQRVSTNLGWTLERILRDLYKNNPSLRAELSGERLKPYSLPHTDIGSSGCHTDVPPVSFDFESISS